MSQRRLIWQLYPSYLLITLAALIAVTAYYSQYSREVYRNQVRDTLSQLAGIAVEQVRTTLETEGPPGVDRLCQRLAGGPRPEGARHGGHGIRLTVVAPAGQVLGDSHENPAGMENHMGRPEISEALRQGTGSSVRFSPTLGTQMMYVALAVRGPDGPVAVLRAASPLAEIDRASHSMYVHLLWAGLAIAAGAAVLSLLIARRLSRPIIGIERVAERFAAGELDLRVPTPASAELAALAGSLNRMAVQLGERITTITAQKNELDAILASMAEGVFAVDNRGCLVSANPATAELLGLDPAEAQGRQVEEVIRNVDLQQFVRQTLAGVQPSEMDISLPVDGARPLSGNGQAWGPELSRSFTLHGAGLTDARGRRTGAVIVLNDMTRIRRLETIRRDFVANVSHELKTPVTSIQGFVEALVEGGVKEPAQIERYLSIIAKHAARLNCIIDDLLTLSRLEEAGERRALRFEAGPLKPVLDEAIALSGVKAEEKRIAVDLVCADKVEARINPPLLEQAVINLIDNAIKYSPEGSRIHVEAHQDQSRVSITIADEGCGIPPEHLPRIFERFYVVDKSRSRKLGGTGLGLAIVKHIAQAHGGRVAVVSTPGQGSTFTISLPI
ncbi:MAG: ATP-binding protein [Planctomycetes bacterium]|nr:ATP-binding protein [Planctomycetota bacterium]